MRSVRSKVVNEKSRLSISFGTNWFGKVRGLTCFNRSVTEAVPPMLTGSVVDDQVPFNVEVTQYYWVSFVKHRMDELTFAARPSNSKAEMQP